MADMNFKIASSMPNIATTIASPKVETSSVSKRTATKEPVTEQTTKQERVQEDNIERDIVAVSKDGDTVAVSKDSVTDAKETNAELVKNAEEEREDVPYEETLPMEQIEAPELHPIEAPKIDEDIDSFQGISDERMEQMLAEDLISQYDYDIEMEARKAEREAATQKEAENQRLAAAERLELAQVEEERMMVKNISLEDGNDRFPPKVRAEALENLQDPQAAEKRRAEEEAKMADYQLVI